MPTATPAHAADPTAPYAELAPDSGKPVPGGQPLSVNALFHNTLDTDVTDSFIVAVGVRLAPPATPLTADQITVEWFDAAASVWRAVELTPGGEQLAESGTPGLVVVAGAAVLVSAGAVALVAMRRPRRS
ncbi:hypothetical protein AB0O67_08105 [Streptomyces sp. NPDC086077]|uniref:hypothetical protein n=1 Tax=Streptomyces sp. NPDC086077 TaxID=3154862 RepID=UPI003449EECE